jgi:shikimate dehydrogenase
MKFAVFGNPIEHSISPIIHKEFAKQFNLHLTYDKILSTTEAFNNDLYRFLQSADGANITIPFKEIAYQLVDNLTDRARLAGAINTIKVNANGNLFGDNTDGAGLLRDLQAHKINLQKVLIIGAGGAVRGILAPLLKQNAHITIINRSMNKALNLANEFGLHGSIKACDKKDLTGTFDLIINATPISFQNVDIDLPASIFSLNTVCYDLAYNLTGKTYFNQWAFDNGCQYCYDGLGMLVFQAAEAFELWTNLKPDTKSVLEFLRN